MLNHKQLEQYHSEGFTVVPFFIDSDQIQKFIFHSTGKNLRLQAEPL
jgi:hypothetical protein